jgi:RNA polymerase sigma-70 factor (ECF subfamily)
MTDEATVPVRPLGSYLSYLRVLASAQFPRQLRGALDPSDVVQKTLLKAHENLAQFRGRTDAELAAWLRRILTNVLTDELRRAAAAARDVALEQSIGPAVAQSSSQLEAWLAGEGTSPSERAVRQEELQRLADALARLPEDQRTAVELQKLQGYSVAAIAAEMRRNKSAVGGLLRRGMRRLRELMQEGQRDVK